MNRFYRIIIAFLVAYPFTGSHPVLAQQISSQLPKVTPQSPNVASLGRYGDYSVNLFTGLPSISIPLYEVKSGSLTLPISLSYHAAGVRHGDQASWVGLNWSLNAGGQVSRKVLGASADEEAAGYLNGTIIQDIHPCDDYGQVEELARGAYDGEPDVFSYSLLNSGGKFTLNQNNQTPTLIPYAPVQVKYENNLSKFEITDEDGTYYRFGKDADNQSWTEQTTDQDGRSSITAWMLTQIAAPNSNDQITFTYQDGGLADVSSGWGDRVNVLDMVYHSGDCGSGPGTPGCSHTATPNPGTNVINSHYYASVGQKDLQYIYFENGKVEFVLSASNRTDQPHQKSLEVINIYNYQGGEYQLQKAIHFLYTYFKDKNGQDLLLKLDEVQIKDKSGVVQQRYQLKYFTNSFSWDINPGVQPGSKRLDYWGFYNGITTNTNLIPKQTFSYQANASSGGTRETLHMGGADRSTVTQYMKEGVLQRIVFPTKGYTEFDFETHKYLGTNNLSTYAGGLRVTKVASYDVNGAALSVKTYKYGLNESGYGNKNFNESLAFYQVQQDYYYDGSVIDAEFLSYQTRTFFGQSLLGLDPYDGSPLVYPYVTEYYGDATSNIGKIAYQYDAGTPAGDVTRTIPGSTKYYKESFHWKRGFLTSKTVYDKNGNKLSQTSNGYGLFNQSQAYKAEVAYKKTLVDGGIPPTPLCVDNTHSSLEYVATNYVVPSGVFKLSSTTQTAYDQSSPSRAVVTTTHYDYQNTDHLQTTETRTATSTSGNIGEQVVTRMKYPTDYTVPASPTGNALALKTLQTQNILTVPIEKYTLRQHTDGTHARVLAGMVNTYQLNPSNTAQVVADQSYLLETTAPLATSGTGSYEIAGVSASAITMDSHYKPRVKIHQYDAYGNPQEFAKQLDASLDDVHQVVLWGYRNSLPIAEVKNAELNRNSQTTAQDVFHTSFEEDSQHTNPQARTGRVSHSGNFTFTKPATNGPYILSYWQKPSSGGGWSYHESLLDISDASPNITIENSNLVDEVRLYPKDAQMTTYTYDPGVGVTSSTDAANVTTYYEYDDLQRLKRVKDQDGNIVKQAIYHYKGQQP